MTKELWLDIYSSRQNQSILTWTVTGVEEFSNTPCLVLNNERIKGLIPLQESGVTEADNYKLTRARLSSFLGQEISFIVTNIDKKNNLFIASRNKAIEKQSNQAWHNLEEGQVKTAIARRIIKRNQDGNSVNIGIQVEIEGIEALLPVQEITYGWIDDLNDFAQPGDEIQVKITAIDKENQKLSISAKALTQNPWLDIEARFSKNSMYAGTVTGNLDYGVFVSLEPGIDVLCKLPKSGRVRIGDTVSVVLTRIAPEEEKLNGVIQRIIRRAV